MPPKRKLDTESAKETKPAKETKKLKETATKNDTKRTSAAEAEEAAETNPLLISKYKRWEYENDDGEWTFCNYHSVKYLNSTLNLLPDSINLQLETSALGKIKKSQKLIRCEDSSDNNQIVFFRLVGKFFKILMEHEREEFV